MAKEQYPKKGFREVRLDGKLRTAESGVSIAPNDFQVLKNLRYNRGALRSIGGQTKINTTATSATALKSAIHFRKDFPAAESHLLAGAKTLILDNTAAVPAQASFSSLVTPGTVTENPRFTIAPNGSVVMCNGTDTMIWYGDETPIGGFLDWDSVGDTYKYDFLEQLSNTKDSDYATLHRYADTVDANTMLLLHCEGTHAANVFTDSSITARTVTLTGNGHTNTNNSYARFGSTSAYFDGDGDRLEIAPADQGTDFDFSGGDFTIDFWVYKPSGESTIPSGTYYYQDSGAESTSFRIKSTGQTLSVLIDAVSVCSLLSSFSSQAQWVHLAFVGEETGGNCNYYIFINGVLSAYSGASATLPADYTGSVFIGDDDSSTAEVTGYIDEFRVSDTPRWTAKFSPASLAYGTGNITALYIACPLPAKGFKFYILTGNDTAGTATVNYWNGSGWTPVTTLSGQGTTPLDGDSTTESWTFDDTKSTAKQKNIDGVISYWYKVEITECDTTTTVYQVTANCGMQQIKDTWDGVYRNVNSFTVFRDLTYQDYTPHVLEDSIDTANDGTYAKLGGFTFSSDYLYVGSMDQLQGIKFGIQGGYVNSNECTMTVEYFDGSDPDSGWVVVSATDGTSSGNISFSKSGTVHWNPPTRTTEFIRNLSGSGVTAFNLLSPPKIGGGGISMDTYLLSTSNPSSPVTPAMMYFYRISFTGNGTTTAFPTEAAATGCHVYSVRLIPAPIDCRGYKFGLTHDDSLFLCNNTDAEPNAVIYSAAWRPQVFNGEEAGKLYFGDATGVVNGVSFANQFGATLHKIALLLKESEVWKISGEYPYTISPVSLVDGIVAPESLDVAEVEVVQGVRRKVAVWVAQRGVVISDGNFIQEISNDIRNLFDPQNDDYLGASVLPTLHGRVDPVFNEYHLVIPNSGEYVFDFTESKWYQVDRGSTAYLNGTVPVYNTDGVAFMYGFTNAGFVMRLDNGTTFASTASTNDIVSTVRLADLALHESSIMFKSRINWSSLMLKTKGTTTATVSAKLYVDGESSGTTTSTVDPTNSGYAYVLGDVHGQSKTGTVHSPEFSITTDDETIGFEPILWGCNYTVYLREK